MTLDRHTLCPAHAAALKSGFRMSTLSTCANPDCAITFERNIMTIKDETFSIPNTLSPVAHAVSLPEEHPATPPKQKRRDYKPAPGRVTVLREVVSGHFNEELDIVKPVKTVDSDRVFAIFATVARVGDTPPGALAPFFKKGDVVSILPSMFDEVELSPGLSVWVGPVASVTGVFEEVTAEEEL